MKRFSRNLTTIYRTERLISRRRFAVVRNQTALVALAGIAALIGMILLNVSFFFLLQERVSGAAAAGILAAGNIALAALLALTAKRMNIEQEIAPVVELRDMAIADLEADVDEATQEIREMAGSLRGLQRDPLGSISTLIVPLLTALLKKRP